MKRSDIGRLTVQVAVCTVISATAALSQQTQQAQQSPPTSVLEVAFGETDITPALKDDQPVWLAGYGPGRRAEKVHDPIMARCVLLRHARQQIALVSVDLVGFQYPDVLRIRERLPDCHVIVSSTHNHEGPDVIGLWGPTVAQRGVDEQYVTDVVTKIVSLVQTCRKQLRAARVKYGAAESESLLGDSRQPYVKDPWLRLLRFESPEGALIGALVQWNCHPEAMGSRNKQLTADFPYVTVAELKERWKAPVAYFSGAVGGLMAPPSTFEGHPQPPPRNDRWDYMKKYGKAVAVLAERAMKNCQDISLTPFESSFQKIAVPIENSYYRTAQTLGVLTRESTVWMDDPLNVTEKPTLLNQLRKRALITEVGWLKLGDLPIACVPGEIYPELVYGKFQTPVEPNVDYPAAEQEPHLQGILGSQKRWMLLGLCNDEIGYLIPKSQWDAKAPFAYGRAKSQYGEINSCSPAAAPIVMDALQRTYTQLK